MIEVIQESKLVTVKTAVELYDELLGYYGRVLRVQTIRTEYDTSDFHYGFDDRDHHYHHSMRKMILPQDRFGKLLGARLHESSSWVEEDEEPTDFSAQLTLVFEGQESVGLNDLQRGRILLLQEDTRQWIPIFKGREWKEVQR